MFFCLGTPLGTPQTGLARLRRTPPHARFTGRVYPSAFSPQRPSLPAVFSGFSGPEAVREAQSDAAAPTAPARVPKGFQWGNQRFAAACEPAPAHRQPPGHGEGRPSQVSGTQKIAPAPRSTP